MNHMNCNQWEVISISLKANESYSNPYDAVPIDDDSDLLRATFTGTTGDATGQVISIVGFWDGGSWWRLNFAPPATGVWQYVTSSADSGLNGQEGVVSVNGWTNQEIADNPARNGFVTVRNTGKNAERIFEYSNGKPFLWIGDTWWFWTDREIKLETFKRVVDNRAEKLFNIGQLFIPGNSTNNRSVLDETYSILDTDHMDKVEEMVRYANSRGITLWIHGWWSREDLAATAGEEKVKRWWRYLIHRFAAYNVIWVGAGEYNKFDNGGFTLDFWKEIGQLIKNEDPYNHMVSLHNTPPFWRGGKGAPQWSIGELLQTESWLDFNQSQVGHGRFKNEMIPWIINREYHRQPTKPVLITESWYEFVEGNPAAMDIRFAAWSAILSGAAGSTYGGGHTWRAHTPESPYIDGTWPVEESFDRNTCDYEGAVSMSHLSAFFSTVHWWDMSPHPEFIMEYPQPLCLANPGEEYVIYLRYGGTIKLIMDESAAANQYRYNFLNPASGEIYDSETIEGAKLLSFDCPELYPHHQVLKDWVLYICKV